MAALALTTSVLLTPAATYAAGGDEPEDVVPPTVGVDPLPDAGWHNTPTTYRIRAVDDTGPLATGVSFVHYRLSGATTATGSLDRTAGGDLTVSNEGITRIEVEAVDGNGNSGYADFQVRVDRTAPTVAITSPQAGSGVVTIPIGGTTRLAYTCADPGATASGIASCGGAVTDGGVLPAAHTGQFVVDLTARDNAGNVTVRPFTYRVSSAITTITRPAVTGTPQVGSVLAATPGTYSPAPATTSCRWERDGLGIAGATDAVYTVHPLDRGHDVTYRCTLTSPGFPDLSVSSDPLHVPLDPMPEVVRNVTVSGPGWVGEMLTLDWEVVQVPLASAGFSLSVRWTRDGAVIPGATDRWYFVTPADHGHRISAVAHAELEGHVPTDYPASNSLDIHGLRSFDVTGTPTVTGTAVVGQTLGAALPEVEPHGPAPVTPYTTTTTWLRDDQPIPGGSGSSYLLRPADVGHRISIRVTAAGPGYATTDLVSAATAVVASGTSSDQARAQITARAKALGHRTVRVKARIAAGTLPVTGEVVVRRGAKVVGTGVVRNGRVVITLRKQKPGPARYRVTYAGSPTVAPAETRIRVRVR